MSIQLNEKVLHEIEHYYDILKNSLSAFTNYSFQGFSGNSDSAIDIYSYQLRAYQNVIAVLPALIEAARKEVQREDERKALLNRSFTKKPDRLIRQFGLMVKALTAKGFLKTTSISRKPTAEYFRPNLYSAFVQDTNTLEYDFRVEIPSELTHELDTGINSQENVFLDLC